MLRVIHRTIFCLQCEREAVWIRMKMVTKRDNWVIVSKRKEAATVKKRIEDMVTNTTVRSVTHCGCDGCHSSVPVCLCIGWQAWFREPEGVEWLDEAARRTVEGLRDAIIHVRKRQRALGLRIHSKFPFHFLHFHLCLIVWIVFL